MGAFHAETVARGVPGAKVSLLYDADRDRAERVARELGATAVGSAEEVIAARGVDAVIVAAPDHLHHELALACLAHGKPTFVEKPLATTLDGAREIVDRESTSERPLIQVGFMRRFDVGFQALRSYVRSGAIGRPRLVHCRHRNVLADAGTDSESILTNSAIHEFDCAPWLVDDEVEAVTVYPAGPTDSPESLRDTQVIVMETYGGVIITCEVSVNARYGYDVQAEVVGESGTASLTAPYGLSTARDGLAGHAVQQDFLERFEAAYRAEISAWVTSLRDGRPPFPSSADGYRASLAAAAAIDSLRTGRRSFVASGPDLRNVR